MSNSLVKSDLVNANETKKLGPEINEPIETPIVSAISDSPVVVPKMSNVKQHQKCSEQPPLVDSKSAGKQKKSKPFVPQDETNVLVQSQPTSAAPVTNEPFVTSHAQITGAAYESGVAQSSSSSSLLLNCAPQPQRVRGERRVSRDKTHDVDKSGLKEAEEKPNGPTSVGSCFNSMHEHVNRPQARSPQQAPPNRTTIPDNRFTTRPGGEPDIEVPLPMPETPSSASAGSPRVDTHDCYEIEDEDDAGWEFVTRPADPLPTDSEALLAAASSPPRRATSELELRSIGAETSPHSPESPLSPASPRSPPAASSNGSLQSDLAPPAPPARARSASQGDLSYDPPQTAGTPHTNLEQMRSPDELDALSVRQLKELLVHNRVAVERADLLQRARLLYADHHKYRSEIENLSLEECCKICMAAPLECVLLECGHIAACTACSRQLAECPICRQYIVRAVRFFRS